VLAVVAAAAKTPAAFIPVRQRLPATKGIKGLKTDI
jgi:hypothetical protein